MSKVLLDTDILSEYLQGHDKTVAHHAASYARQHGSFTFRVLRYTKSSALRLDLLLVTGNTEDFQAIQRTGVKLTIENWRKV